MQRIEAIRLYTEMLKAWHSDLDPEKAREYALQILHPTGLNAGQMFDVISLIERTQPSHEG